MEINHGLCDGNAWKTCLYVIPMFTSEMNGFVMIICVNIVRHCAFLHLFRTN